MTAEQVKKHNARVATKLCELHGCTEKARKLHFDMIVHRAWNPHPSAEFVQWWSKHPDANNPGIDAVRARNCKCYCDEYKEAVSVGLASFPIDHPAARR